MSKSYEDYIKQEKIMGLVHGISGVILTMISDDEVLNPEDGIYILKEASKRCVKILAEMDRS